MIALTLQDVSKAFGGVQAVVDCSFEIQAKKITALIGPNGAGKTTLFNIINGFLDLDQGKIIFGGEDVTALTVWQRSRLGLSRAFQMARFFKNLSIGDNLRLALREDDEQFWKMFFQKSSANQYELRIKQALEFIGLEKSLATKVTDLSYGEQKLFDLARALLNRHSLLLLDEPVSGVNPVVRAKLKQIMSQLRGQAETILLIEHDMDFVRNVADWVIVMNQGMVLEAGSPEEVLRDKKVLEAYLGPDF